MKLHALLITIVLALGFHAIPAAAQATLPKMVPKIVSKEGNPVDLAGVSSVGASDDLKRIWGGGGRRRNAWEPNSRGRNFNEEAKDLPTSAVAYESDVSSPNPLEHRLFTLTKRERLKDDAGVPATTIPARLRVERILDQTDPELVQEIVFDDAETPQFMRAFPTDTLLLVGGGAPGGPRIKIYSYASGSLVEKGSATLPPTGSQVPTSCGHFFKNLKDVQVAYVQVETPPGSGVWTEERMGLVTATMVTPALEPTCDDSALTSQTRGLLVLNLQDVDNPYWYDDFSTQAWDPCRNPTEDCDEWYTAGFCHVRAVDPTHPSHHLRDYVYMTGGPKVGIRRLDVTDVANPTVGIAPDIMSGLEYLPGKPDGLFAIRPDPDDSDVLYVYGRQRAYVVARPTVDGGPATYVKSSLPSDLNFTNAGDTHLVLVDPGAGPVQRESWTLARSSVDHVLRVTQFTQDGVGGLEAPDTADGRFSAGPTDGAAADLNNSSVYALTFGGVVRWDITGSELLPDPSSYRPATFGGMNHTTEDLAFVDLSDTGSPPDWQLIANTADGGFVSWAVDRTSVPPNPQAVSYWEPPPPPGAEDFWPAKPGYGNDIDIWDQAGKKWVVLDFSSDATKELGIGAVRWSTKSWGPPPPAYPRAIKWTDPGGGPMGWAIEPKIRDLYVDRNCVVAGANHGFLLSRIPMQAVTDFVYTDAVGGLAFDRVMGVAIYGDPTDGYPDRLFVSLGDTVDPPGSSDPNNRFAFAMYGFNPVNGTVVDPVTGQPTETPIQVLFDGQPGKPDDFPGVFVEEGEQITLIRVSADPLKLRLFSGSKNGVTLDIEYDGSTDLMTPKSYWHNGGYFGSVAEATPYLVPKPGGGLSGFGAGFGGPVIDYALKLLVTKHQETIEIVSPPDMQ